MTPMSTNILLPRGFWSPAITVHKLSPVLMTIYIVVKKQPWSSFPASLHKKAYQMFYVKMITCYMISLTLLSQIYNLGAKQRAIQTYLFNKNQLVIHKFS